jgi:hypothetical protein
MVLRICCINKMYHQNEIRETQFSNSFALSDRALYTGGVLYV